MGGWRGWFALGVLLTIASGLLASSASGHATCTIYWTGTTSSEWGTVGNWSNTNGGASAGRIPGAGDFVCMSSAPKTAAVDLAASSTATIAGIDWPAAGGVKPSLQIGGTLTVGDSSGVDASTLDDLSIGSGAVLDSYPGQQLAVTNLILRGTVEGPGQVVVSGPTNLANGATLGNSAGGGAADLVLDGSTSVASSSVVFFYSGSVVHNAGTMTLSDGANLINADGDASDELVNERGGTLSYTGTASNGTATVGVAAANDGTVSVGAGSLFFGGAGVAVTDTGSFHAVSGTTLGFEGTRTEESGMTVAGAGTVSIVHGTATFAAGVSLTSATGFGVGAGGKMGRSCRFRG